MLDRHNVSAGTLMLWVLESTYDISCLSLSCKSTYR